MPLERCLGPASLGLPDSAKRIDDPQSDNERRWLTEHGLYIVLTVLATPPIPKDPEVAVEFPFADTLARYREQFGATVQTNVASEMPTGEPVRLCRLALDNAGGEAIELLLLATITLDRQLVMLQVSWPAGSSDILSAEALDLASTLTLDAT